MSAVDSYVPSPNNHSVDDDFQFDGSGNIRVNTFIPTVNELAAIFLMMAPHHLLAQS